MSVNALGVVSANSLQQVDNDSAAKTVGSRTPTVPRQVAPEDTTSFTSHEQTVHSLSQAAIQTFPTRQAKVEALKEAVNGAQYQLDSAKIAAALVNTEF